MGSFLKSTTLKKDKNRKPTAPKVARTHKPDGMGLEEWQLELRKQFGQAQSFIMKNIGAHPIFSEFHITNPTSGKTYKIAIRGDKPGDNYCSCPDFKVNNLGSCKHIEFTLASLMKKTGTINAFLKGFKQLYSEIYLRYGLKRSVCFKPGVNAPESLVRQVNIFFNSDGFLNENHFHDFSEFLKNLPPAEVHEVRFYNDALEFIAMNQDAAHRLELIEERFPDGIDNPLFDNLLKTGLYSYQKEGALFAAKAGRCLIGDDMGLGKTIQALAAVELMSELFGIKRVLIISPTSLKYQWLSEIEKFTDRTAQVIEGMSHKHREQFKSETFYKLINYELVARDVKTINNWTPDLIILDEAQRIKNWQTRTAKTIKALQSQFAIVLTGTPIENKIEELHSIVEFIDMHHLGPLYRFVHNHRVTDFAGKITGYKDLNEIRNALKKVLIRRKKSDVLKQLPDQLDKFLFVPVTKEQADIHIENQEIVARLAAKWRRYHFLCDADIRRMQCALANMRMVSDNTWLIDRTTKHGPKIDELEILIKELVVDAGEKAVIFSQWIRMNELVEEVLERNGIGFVHLNGSVPSRDRRGLMNRFKNDPSCRVFLSTDAGGVGLNLQSGSVVINMDIPWNPAILEQRIGRVHRMGQKNIVRVVNFVSKGTIEERILDLIKFKKALFAGALDVDGESMVSIGKSQIESFMETVEAVTVNLEKDIKPDIEQKAKSDEDASQTVLADDETAKPEPSNDIRAIIAGINPEMIQNILLAGARFLEGLGSAMNTETKTAATVNYDKLLQGAGKLIDRDEWTGRDCLKIPLPEPQVIKEIATGLSRLFSSLVR